MLDLSGLNPQQREAVETTDGPLLILAGAGTGKTRVLTCRIARLVEKGASPGHILGVTFTNKAAREMRERVRHLLEPGPRRRGAKAESSPESRPTICTFHSLCVRILRRHIGRLGYRPDFVICDEADQLSAIKKILSPLAAAGEKMEPRDILPRLAKRRTAVALDDESGGAEGGDLAAWLQPRYEQALRACNTVDFDDLLILVWKLFREHPEALAECRERYHHLLVDEYQDTNALQFRLARALAQEHRNLCVVGDDDQSIYSWRGADLSNLLDIEKSFPEIKIIRLEQNYRSTNTILKAANALIQNNARRRSKRLWSSRGEGERIALRTCADEQAEGRAIVEAIEGARILQCVPWSEQAILFRTNQQARALETALRQASIRYKVVGGQSFFDRREVRDFLAFLRLLLNPEDDMSLLRVVNVPPRGLSDSTMERLLALSAERKSSVFAAMREGAAGGGFRDSTLRRIQAFVTLVENVRLPLTAQPALALGGWAKQFLTDIGYFQDLRRLEKEQETAENRIRNLEELLRALDEASPQTPAPERLGKFLEDLALDGEREEPADNADTLTLITMHSCKGLEFPHVYVVGVEDGLIPHTRSKVEGTLDEERRLFYVALTRAMKRLTLSYCLARRKYGENSPCHPSPFLRELPPELLENADEQAKKPVAVSSGRGLFDQIRNSLGGG